MKRYLKSLPYVMPLPACMLVVGRPDLAFGIAVSLIVSVIVYTQFEDVL